MKRFFLSTFFVPTLALAAGYQNPAVSASDIATASAGGGSAIENASAQAYNPASLARLKGTNFSLGAVGVKHRARFTDSTMPNLASAWLATGNFYASAEVGDSWVVGFSVNQPFLMENNYDNPWGAGDWTQKAELSVTQFSPNVAWRIHDKFSLGLGLSYAKAQWRFQNSIFSYDDKDNALGWNAGILLTPSETMNVSISYQSPFHFKGNAWRLKTPAKFTITTWQELMRGWELMGKVEYTKWENNSVQFSGSGLHLPPITNKHGLKIAWGTALSFHPNWKWKFGIAYDKSPMRTSERAAALPQHNDWYFSTGLRYAHETYGALDFGYSYVYSTKSDAQGQGISGRFETRAHLIGLQYSIGF